MNIKFNYLSNRVKAGIGAFILIGSLSSCSKNSLNNISSKNNNDEAIISSVVNSNEDIPVVLGISSSWKDLNFGDEEREYLNDVANGNNVVFNISDKNSNDNIENLEVTIVDSDNNIVDSFVTGSFRFVFRNFNYGEQYNIVINNLPVEYSNTGVLVYTMKINRDSFGDKFLNDKDYYNVITANIVLEKERDSILIENNEMLPGEIVVSAYEYGNNYIDGVSFSVLDSQGKEIDNWLSGKNYHIVYNLSDGNYIVRINNIPDDYELDCVVGKSSDDYTLSSSEYDVTIKNGRYMDNDYPDKSYGGPTFYFSSSKNKTLDSNVRLLKK